MEQERDEGQRGCGGRTRKDLEEELRDLSIKVTSLGRSLAAERGRSLAEGGARRALEIAVGGAQARVGGACRARDRAYERLRLQQEAERQLWAELEAAREALEGAELRAKEAESKRRGREAELDRLRQAVAAANHERRKAEQERDDVAAQRPRPVSTIAHGCQGLRDPRVLEAALMELRAHNRELQQRLSQRQAQVLELGRALAAAALRAQESAHARWRLEAEQRSLRGRSLWEPPARAEAALSARCSHVGELLRRETEARGALLRSARSARRRLRALRGELQEQRLRGERYRLQAQALEVMCRAVAERVAAVAAGTSRDQAQGWRLRQELEAAGDGAAATARHVTALRARLRCDPLTLSRTVRRMLRGEDEDTDDSDGDSDGDSSEDKEFPPLDP
ncbi:myosin heavy chain, embryonic smooth muscle isoform-like [Pezoporus occidentalis]|uniref:myosin heavy chain, embryonic smooth muscle isoform-like n=1 Tax=Pezoporus occidentalis TaxID=407982 RepID=UPI002F910764